MTQWYIKELSKITHVSVRTLHHYDAVDLLKPSIRLDNGYRVYSEADLLKLQQIIALKFFGFELSQIKILLADKVDIFGHFVVQSQLLQQKAKTLLTASQTLNNIIAECSGNQSIPWKTIIELIEVYRMTQQLEKTWAGKIFNAEELKEYARFEHALQTKPVAEKHAFEQAWDDLIAEIGANLKRDPYSDFGIAIGKRCMDLVNNLYGQENIAMRNTIWNKGFKAGVMDGDHALAPEIVTWLDQAQDAYYKQRIYGVLSQIKTEMPAAKVQTEWQELLTEISGDNKAEKQELIAAAVSDPKVGAMAKSWLKKLLKA